MTHGLCAIEPGETDEAALNREIRERMGVDVRVGCRKARRIHQYVGYSVDWVRYEQYPFPPADQATTDQILGLGFC